MAMIKTGLGMLVDMTVPIHPGPYTDLMTVDGPTSYPVSGNNVDGQPWIKGEPAATPADIDRMRKEIMSS